VVGVSLVIIAVVIAVTIRLDRDLRRRDPTSNGIGFDDVGRVGANHCGEVDHPPAVAMPDWAHPRPRQGPRRASRACLGHGGGHTTWTCRLCDETVYGPPLNTHCTTLEGPATVRISSHPG
jgi:hypothetical protein